MLRNIIFRVMLALLIIGLLPIASLQAKNIDDSGVELAFDKTASVMPNTQLRVHKVGNTRLAITNFGFWGMLLNEGYVDPETGMETESCEHPAGSKIEHIYMAGLWIGAIVDDDTLVSVGVDGWQSVYEMYPAASPGGGIEKRSNIPSDPDYNPEAVSEADYIAVYYDTLVDPAYVAPTPFDNRPHIPIGLEITQSSYSWSIPAYEDFILFRFKVKNISDSFLDDVVFGLYHDADILQYEVHPNGFSDDISGHYSGVDQNSGKFVRIAWSADNNGDPNGLNWDFASARSVLGISLLDFPQMRNYSFNWWVPASYLPAVFDWGPMRSENYRDYGTGGLGTPAGDCNKYYIMTNNEIDYDQIYTAFDHTGQGWLPRPSPELINDLPDGYDTRFLMSFGTADLLAGDSVIFGFVLTVGDSLHQNPQDFINLFDADNPDSFCNSLDFSDLVNDVVTAQNLYDSLFPVEYICGDANHDGAVEISDVVYIINYIFVSGTPPYPAASGDVNCDNKISLVDIIYMVNYLFRGGLEPGDINGDGVPDC